MSSVFPTCRIVKQGRPHRSALHATQFTPLVCPSNTRIHLPDATSQSLMLLSSLPERAYC